MNDENQNLPPEPLFHLETEKWEGEIEKSHSGFIEQLPKGEQVALKNKMWNKVSEGINKQTTTAQSRRNRRIRTIAASAVILMGINTLLWYGFKTVAHTFETGSEETLAIKLPDGTEVFMNSNSKLGFMTSYFGGFSRNVHLTGEAYFHVAKNDGNRRFVVNEGDELEIEVFGTEFNLKNRHPTHKLILVEGSVMLAFENESGRMSRVVKPGEAIRYIAMEKKIETRILEDPGKLLAWRKGKLIMEDESLSDVLETLSDLYDVSLSFESKKPLIQRVSGSLPLRGDLQEILGNVSVLFGTEIILENNLVRVL